MFPQILEKQTGRVTNQIDTMAGAKGGTYISSTGTATYTGINMGFVSWDDATVISVLTINGASGLTETGLTAIPIPKGMLVTWSSPAAVITVLAGGGWVIKG